jgi:hypothetical protein
MMRSGYGRGTGYGPGMIDGPGWGGPGPMHGWGRGGDLNLTADQVKSFLEQRMITRA